MSRIAGCFASTAIVLLLFGLLSPRWFANLGLTVPGRGTTYMLSLGAVANGVAVVFCSFAFLYSMWMVRWSARAAGWHLGLSLVALVLSVAGFVAMNRAGAGAQPGGALTLVEQAAVALFAVGPALFLLAQGWFVLDSVRRVWMFWMRTTPG